MSVDTGGYVNEFVELDVVAVIAITIATFASLLAAVRGGKLHEWVQRPRLGFWLPLNYSLGALGFSLLPSILRDLGIESWVSAILFWSLFGGLGGPSYGVYHFGVTVCLLSAVNSFVAFLRLDRHA